MHTQFGRSALGFSFSSEHKGKTMKKVLFASTALVATAGIAAADVALSGYAEMGVAGSDSMETQFHTDIDVTFTLSGESDGGITFGAAVDLDEAANIGSGDPASDSDGVAVFISGDFGTLTMGDTDGALDWAMTEAAVGNAGSIADNETGHQGYLGSYLDGAYDGQILRYDYSFGDFAFAASVEMDDSGMRDNGYALGARYSMDFGGGSVTVGAGYQMATYISSDTPPATLNIATIQIDDYLGVPTDYEVEVTAMGISAAVTLDSGLSAAVAYTQFDADYSAGDGEMTHLGLGVGYTFDAVTVSANYGMFDGEFFPGQEIDESGFGVAAAYDLGGGLSAHLGYGSSDIGGTNTNAGTSNSWSFGLAMSF